MKSAFAKAREFVRGAARYHDLCYVISKGKALMKEDIAHASLICVDEGDWADGVDVEWDSTALAVAKLPSEKAVLIGEDGDVCTYVGGKTGRETIKPAPVLIRNARTIDGHVYACGMKRQVFHRTGERAWSDISAPPPKREEEVGFEAIDGFSHKEIYAVGWKGEIWQYNGRKWTNRGSPTSLIMTAVCCAGDGVVYVAGQQGVMVRGREDEWEVIEWDQDVSDDLWDLCWFKKKLYVSTMSWLHTLNGNALAPLDIEIDIDSFYSLTAIDDVMWSVGRNDVASFDGRNWRRYD
jgi:hypothetical protein